jgi:hypothetical protein
MEQRKLDWQGLERLCLGRLSLGRLSLERLRLEQLGVELTMPDAVVRP